MHGNEIINLSALENLDRLFLKTAFIKPTSFQNLTTLRYLHLERCSFAKNDENTFAHLINLEVLAINYAWLTKRNQEHYFLNLDHLDSLKHFKWLDLSNIKIDKSNNRFLSKISDQLIGLRLTSLKINENLYTDFFKDAHFSNLAFFELDIPIQLGIVENLLKKQITDLKEFRLHFTIYNRIGNNFMHQLGHFSSLECLNFSGNYINCVNNESLSKLVNLKELHMSGIKVVELLGESPFKALTKLEKLRIYHISFAKLASDGYTSIGALKEINENFLDGLDNLEELELYQNGTVSIQPQAFSRLPKLKFLRLFEKDFNVDSRIFSGLGHLQRLVIEYTSLRVIDENLFASLVSIEEISLRQNHIEKMSLDAFKKNIKLRKLDLSCNPILDQYETFDMSLFVALRNVNLVGLKFANWAEIEDVDQFSSACFNHFYPFLKTNSLNMKLVL